MIDTPVQKKILVVEDDYDITEIVKRTLTKSDFHVITANSGEEGLSNIKRYGLPHLAIVDIKMPGMDGFEFCTHLHKFSDVPVILLTANDEEDMIVTGIEEHAEDYMTKPFSPRELVARINRVLRRIGDFDYTLDAITTVDATLQVDFANQELLVNGEKQALTPTETKLLYILMRSTGRIVTTDFLIKRLWPFEIAFEDRLRVHVHRLRRKLKAKDQKHQYISSERGTGYRFNKI